jgi:hypothetical protein
MDGIPHTPKEAAMYIATIPGISDTRVEGDCVYYTYTPPYPLTRIRQDLRLRERPGLEVQFRKHRA